MDGDGVAELVGQRSVTCDQFGELNTGGRVEEIRRTRACKIREVRVGLTFVPRPYGHDAVVDGDGAAEPVTRRSVRSEEFGNLNPGGRIEEIRRTRVSVIAVIFPRPYGDDAVVDGDGLTELVIRTAVAWEEFVDLSTGGRIEKIRRTRACKIRAIRVGDTLVPRPYGHDAVVDVDGVAERVPRRSVRREEFGNLSTGGRIEEIRGTRAIEIVVVFPRPYRNDAVVDGN